MQAATKKREDRTIKATNFRDHCSAVMDEVDELNLELIITKRGRPVARFYKPAPDSETFLLAPSNSEENSAR